MRHLLVHLACAAALTAPAWSQSNPDAPAPLKTDTITGSLSGGLSDEVVTYHKFRVTPGNLRMTVDITPKEKSDAGGLVNWYLLNEKFDQLKMDNLSAQGSPGRKINDIPVSVKRTIILKLVSCGNADYKIRFAGKAFHPIP